MSTQLSIPPLPPDTSGKWIGVDSHDRAMVVRWLTVNRQMDRHYRAEKVTHFINSMAHMVSAYGAAYYYWVPGGEVVMRLVRNRSRSMYQLQSAGFVGNITPIQALDLVVDQAIQYLGMQQASSAFAVVPRQMDNPRMLEFIDLVPNHSRLQLTTMRESPSTFIWKFDIPELQSP